MLFKKRLPAAFSVTAAAFALWAAQENVQVHVTGRGDSEFAARSDAVRQALQQTMSQLVIADRVVQGEQLVRDTVMSTMNGFVDRFETVRIYHEGSETVTEAVVSVSSSRIQNFLSTSTGTSTSVRGDDLSASLTGQRLSGQARAEILWRLFGGFPGRAITVKIDKVAASEKDPSLIAVDYSLATNPNFIASLKAGLKALNRAPRAATVSSAQTNSFGLKLRDWHQSVERMGTSEKGQTNSSNVCFGNNLEEVEYSVPSSWDCYPLPAATYRDYYFKHYAAEAESARFLLGGLERLVFLVDLVDHTGASLLRDRVVRIETNQVVLKSTQNYQDDRKVEAGEWPLQLYVNVLKSRKGRFVVPISKIDDPRRLARIVIVAAATGRMCGPRKALFDMPGCKSWTQMLQEVRSAAELEASDSAGRMAAAPGSGPVSTAPAGSTQLPTSPVKLRTGTYTNKRGAAPQPFSQSREEGVRAAVASPLDSSALGLVVETRRAGHPESNTMEVLIYIDPRSVRFEKAGERMIGKVEVFFAQKDDRGVAFNGTNDSLNLSLTQANYDAVMHASLSYRQNVSLAAQARQLRIVVRDDPSGTIGSVTVPLN